MRSLSGLLWARSALLSGLALVQQPADEKPAVGVRLRVGGEQVLGIHHIHHSPGRSALDANAQPGGAPTKYVRQDKHYYTYSEGHKTKK